MLTWLSIDCVFVFFHTTLLILIWKILHNYLLILIWKILVDSLILSAAIDNYTLQKLSAFQL